MTIQAQYAAGLRYGRPVCWRVWLLGALILSYGCRRTDVVAPPHAGVGEVSTGQVLHSQLGGGQLSSGIVAVSEVRRGDLVWRVIDGGEKMQLCHTRWCSEPLAPPGTEAPRGNISFLESAEPRPSSPRAGVWLAGGTPLRYLHYCWVTEQGQPMCEAAQSGGSPVMVFAALSTHTLRRGDVIEDVIWLGFATLMTRCRRGEQHATCETLAVQ